MKITTTDISDFLTNLKDAQVYRRVVYFERSKHHLNGKTKHDATAFQIIYQTSAILEYETDGQALLVCGVDCGVDRLNEDGGSGGSDVLEELHKRLWGYCELNGLRLLPGMLDQ